MQCKSLWIKASAKCINVNVNNLLNMNIQETTNPFGLKWWNIVQNKVQPLSCPNRALCINKLNENIEIKIYKNVQCPPIILAPLVSIGFYKQRRL